MGRNTAITRPGTRPKQKPCTVFWNAKWFQNFTTAIRNGIPSAWVARVRESMAQLTPRFSASRAVREYSEKHYIPGAAAFRARAADKGAVGKQMFDWCQDLDRHWAALRFGEVKVETNRENHLFEVQVFTHDLDPNSFRVELYADGANGGIAVRQEMKQLREVYSAEVPASRPATDYTVRLVPYFSGAAVPLEAPQILWQH